LAEPIALICENLLQRTDFASLTLGDSGTVSKGHDIVVQKRQRRPRAQIKWGEMKRSTV
jgi:hypothetical protein